VATCSLHTTAGAFIHITSIDKAVLVELIKNERLSIERVSRGGCVLLPGSIRVLVLVRKDVTHAVQSD